MTMMFLNQMAFEDFEHARRKARWHDWLSRLTHRPNKLLSLGEILQQLQYKSSSYVGQQIVPLDRIVGSEGRSNEFDRAFFPRQSHTRERWISIDKAHYEDVFLPPIELVKIDDMYFVTDGNHRVSVARARGHTFVDALVTEFTAPEANQKAQPTAN